MKKLITLLFLIPLLAHAQTDSMQIKVSVTLQARDCEYLGKYIAYEQAFEDLFDGMKAKFRVSNPPSGTTNVTVDTIPIGQWLGVEILLRRDPYAIGGNVWSRLNAALRAANNSFLTGQLDGQDAIDVSLFNENRLIGRFRLRKTQ